ncbi:Eco29kI family restriction endonuclease [Mycobacteroides abscessus]|uniref:Eco29kI family restriction endonuclease n=1 Tax=Mycobacteroides abscessus TaxID=36809 RepID=UPI000C269050|nr:Eco29kI family restriction endonuclease [Mycobacteroides abscessus]RIR68079.1 Eco29kI family restriction endonuclease [Mycobacteroides abscessus]
MQIGRNIMTATGEFRLSLTKAMADQLEEALRQLVPSPLQEEELADVATRGGVYQLYRRGDLVYVGKADTSLQERLDQHRRKIRGRVNVTLDEMTFTALYVVEDLSAFAPEKLLIDRYKAERTSPWNFNGFGNKDPGRERDTSAVEVSHFDSLYPANSDWICTSIAAGSHRLVDLLATLKKELPFVFRYQDGNMKKSSQPKLYHDMIVEIPEAGMTADDIFAEIALYLPADWQITAFPGYVIMYREQKAYKHAWKIYQGP